MKYLKTYENILTNFKVGDIVYANPNFIENQMITNQKFEIIRILPSNYVVVNLFPNVPLKPTRLISEEEYNINKYNL